MDENGLGLTVIQEVIEGLGPLDGAKDFLCLAKIRISGGHPVGHFLRICPPFNATAGMANTILPSP